MVEVRFINDTTPIEVTSETQETEIEVTSETQETEIEVGGLTHSDLSGRDLPDQHPIDAITGLRDELDNIITGADKHFVFEQEIPSDTWQITHNLEKRPSVTVVDSAGNMQMPDEVTYNDDNTITIKFVGSFAGKAFLN